MKIKIQKSERKVLLDTPALLIIHPLTWKASKKYGHKTSWCTATSNDSYFKDYTKKGLLVYCLIYKIDENGKRIGDTKTKLALYKAYRKNQTWHCFDMKDRDFDANLIFFGLDQQYHLSSILDEYYRTVAPERVFKVTKPVIAPCKIGDLIQGIGDRKIKVVIGKKPYVRHLYTQQKGWHNEKSKFETQYAIVDIKQSEIKKAEVLHVGTRQTKVKIIALDTSNNMANLLFNGVDFTVNLYLNRKSPNFKVIPPSCELPHDILSTPSSQFNANQSYLSNT